MATQYVHFISFTAQITKHTATRSIFQFQKSKQSFKCQNEFYYKNKKCNRSIYYYRDYQRSKCFTFFYGVAINAHYHNVGKMFPCLWDIFSWKSLGYKLLQGNSFQIRLQQQQILAGTILFELKLIKEKKSLLHFVNIIQIKTCIFICINIYVKIYVSADNINSKVKQNTKDSL